MNCRPADVGQRLPAQRLDVAVVAGDARRAHRAPRPSTSTTPHPARQRGRALRPRPSRPSTTSARPDDGFDLVIRGGTIVDGTGKPGCRAATSASRTARSSRSGKADGAPPRRPIDADRQGRRAGLRRHPHPLRRAGPVGPHADASRPGTASPRVVIGNCGFGVAPTRPDAPRAHHPHAREGRGHERSTRSRPGSATSGRSRPSRSISTRVEARGTAINVARPVRPHAAAPLRHGRGRDRARRHAPTRSPRCGRSCARRWTPARIGFAHVEVDHPRRLRRQAGAEPPAAVEEMDDARSARWASWSAA